MKRTLHLAEFLILFIALPPVIYELELKRGVMLVMWGFALAVWLYLRRQPDFSFRRTWNWGAVTAKNLRPIALRLAVAALLLGAAVAWLEPQRFLSLPRQRPLLWGMIMVLYPLLSVVPQELIYRAFFFRRYGELFKTPRSLVTASAVAFGLAHTVLGNAVAVGLCLIGGWMFAHTYRLRHSLALACIEHALYGCLVFTLGLGWYFYSGAGA